MRRAALLVVAALLCHAPVTAKSPAPRIILDHYYLLPNEYFEFPRSARKNWLEQPGTIVDVRNGYMKIMPDGAQMKLEICLFRRSDRTYVVAISNDGSDDPEGMTLFNLLVLERGKWRDVTRQLLPASASSKLAYRLPRVGRTIHVTTVSGRRLYNLAWNGRRFIRHSSGR